MTTVYEEEIEKQLHDILERYKDSTYKDLSVNQINYLFSKFVDHVKKSYSYYTSNQELDWCKNDVLKTVEQVWKRKIYFRIFHNGVTEMNELKEVSLYCFWILKLQPFFLRGEYLGNTDSTSRFNAAIALRVLIHGLKIYSNNMNKKEADEAKRNPQHKKQIFKPNINKSMVYNLHYSFHIRDWSKEALMDLCESLIIVETPVHCDGDTSMETALNTAG
ncbi:MAG: hypothetical protein LBB56_02615 [Chitinispirillales bacterium]|jgi:hypothetical protein|nr:hypothetical protein [Chitinispirillales bacterium]